MVQAAAAVLASPKQECRGNTFHKWKVFSPALPHGLRPWGGCRLQKKDKTEGGIMSNKIGTSYSSNLARYYANQSRDAKAAKAEQAAQTDKTGKSESRSSELTFKNGSEVLKHLQDKFSDYSFTASDSKQAAYQTTSGKTNVAISPQFLNKMAKSPELREKYETEIASMSELDKQNLKQHASQGTKLTSQGWNIDKNGGISKWSKGTGTTRKRYSAFGENSVSNSLSPASKQSTFNWDSLASGRRLSNSQKKFLLGYGLSGGLSSNNNSLTSRLAELRSTLKKKI